MTALAVRGSAADPAAHVRRWLPGVVQTTSPPCTIDLGPGYLEPALLPVGAVRDACAEALEEFGAAALSYGHDPGVDLLRELLAGRATAADRTPCRAANVLLTAGTSQALHLLATTFARPGDVALTEDVGYDLGHRILVDCGLRPVRVPGDVEGPLPDAFELLLERGPRPALFYVNPTHHNPLGRVVPLARRRALVEIAARYRLLVIEDDAYSELGFDDEPLPPSLAALAGYRGAVRLGTFSKTLGPGLRLGWLLADPSVVTVLVGHGLLRSGGSLNHLASLTAAVLLRDGRYDERLIDLRTQLRARRDALVDALAAYLGERVGFRRPAGGYFLWLRLPLEMNEATALQAAARAGVAVAPGSRFGPTRRPCVRLAYSAAPPALLRTSVQRLADGWSQ
jgi:enduracididine biosynthesis enzyme MppQ